MILRFQNAVENFSLILDLLLQLSVISDHVDASAQQPEKYYWNLTKVGSHNFVLRQYFSLRFFKPYLRYLKTTNPDFIMNISAMEK